MSFRPISSPGSQGQGSQADADARQPLLADARQPLSENGRTPGTALRPPRPPPRPDSPFLSSFFSSGSRPTSPVVVDTSDFDAIRMVFSREIPLNVLDGALAEIESDIVKQYFDTGSSDPLIISERLEPILFSFRRLHPEIREKQINRAIVRVLDEIHFYGLGCSQVQITKLEQDLARLKQEKTAVLEEEKEDGISMGRLMAWANESKEEKLEREAKKRIKDKRTQTRERETNLLERQIPHYETLREQRKAESLLSNFNANDVRECAFVRYCRARFGREDEFCGRATIESNASTGILDKPEPVNIKFELVIDGNGADSDATSVRLTKFCQFASPDSPEYLPFDQVYAREENRARQIKEDAKNALFNQFRDTPDSNVETHGLAVIAFEPKQCASVGKKDRLFEDPDEKCCTKCNILGGAKKIKRTRQSKKKRCAVQNRNQKGCVVKINRAEINHVFGYFDE